MDVGLRNVGCGWIWNVMVNERTSEKIWRFLHDFFWCMLWECISFFFSFLEKEAENGIYRGWFQIFNLILGSWTRLRPLLHRSPEQHLRLKWFLQGRLDLFDRGYPLLPWQIWEPLQSAWSTLVKQEYVKIYTIMRKSIVSEALYDLGVDTGSPSLRLEDVLGADWVVDQVLVERHQGRHQHCLCAHIFSVFECGVCRGYCIQGVCR